MKFDLYYYYYLSALIYESIFDLTNKFLNLSSD